MSHQNIKNNDENTYKTKENLETNFSDDQKESKSHLEGKLELLEERAVVDKERLDVGKINVSKQVRTRTVNVPIELAEEVLVIDTEYFDPDSRELLNRDIGNNELVRLIEPTLENRPTIKVNGSEIALDEGPVEVVISRQIALIQKETHVVQDISIEKTTHTHKDSFEVELRHEELDVDEQGYIDQHSSKS